MPSLSDASSWRKKPPRLRRASASPFWKSPTTIASMVTVRPTRALAAPAPWTDEISVTSSLRMVPVAVPALVLTAAVTPAWFVVAVRSARAKVSAASGSRSPWTVTVTSAEAAPAGIVPAIVSGRAGLPARSPPETGLAPVPESSVVKSTAPSVPLLRWIVKVRVVVPVSPSGILTVREPGAKAISWV